jgi:predicted membrane-bound mannosyltransferase
MLYQYFERRHGMNHEAQSRLNGTVRILTWMRSIYMFISAIVLAFAIVKGEAFLAFASLSFLGASFAFKRLALKISQEKGEKWNGFSART